MKKLLDAIQIEVKIEEEIPEDIQDIIKSSNEEEKRTKGIRRKLNN